MKAWMALYLMSYTRKEHEQYIYIVIYAHVAKHVVVIIIIIITSIIIFVVVVVVIVVTTIQLVYTGLPGWQPF